MNLAEMPGKLIVIEGTDGVGRSTQIRLLRPWLEQQGRAVLDTAIKRSELAGKGIQQAKEGHTLGRITLSLFYATDFADRLEHEIVPALRAGFVVLTDRYIYSLMARAIVRGADPRWIRNAYGFALKPDATFYLRIGVDDLIPRVVFSRGFDYWESGMDIHPSEDMYDSFRKYQTELLAEFERLAKEYNFEVIDATPDVRTVFEHLRAGVARVLSGEPREPLFSVVAPAGGDRRRQLPRKCWKCPRPPSPPLRPQRNPRPRLRLWRERRKATPTRRKPTLSTGCISTDSRGHAGILLFEAHFIFPVAQDQLFHFHRQGQVFAQEFRPRQHLDHHLLQHFQVVPIPQMLLELAEPRQGVGAARHAELMENLQEIAQPLGGNARPVDDLRDGSGDAIRSIWSSKRPQADSRALVRSLAKRGSALRADERDARRTDRAPCRDGGIPSGSRKRLPG